MSIQPASLPEKTWRPRKVASEWSAPDARADRHALPERAAGAHVLGRGLRRSDRLHGSDASGLASRAGLPGLPRCRSKSGSRTKARPAKPFARIAASAGSTTALQSNAAAIACSSRSSSTSFAGPGAGKWPCSIFPASPRRLMSNGWSACRASSIQIKGGDVFVNDRLARKSLSEIRAMRMLVHDSQFQPQNADRVPRWLFRSGSALENAPSGWKQEAGRFVHAARRRPGLRRLGRLQALGFRPRRLWQHDRFSRLQRQ